MIDFRADCSSDDVYREVRNWMFLLDNEIKNISLNIQEIFPRISQKKAFEIIEGDSIYEDKLTFLREFIQNALDASKIQLWKDLNDGLYDFLLKDELAKSTEENKYSNLTPFELLKYGIFDNYEIGIHVKNMKNGNIKVIIEDKGTGINIDNMKAMCDVGKSYNDETYDDIYDIESMPALLHPTGSFGIGLQSAFLVTDRFKAYTRCQGSDDVMEITFEQADIGYISIRQSSENIRRGTRMEIEVGDSKYKQNGIVDDFITNEYDVFKKANMTFYKLLDYLYDNIYSVFFKVAIYIDGKEKKYINERKQFFKSDNGNDRYLYTIQEYSDEMLISSENLIWSTMLIWDKMKSVYFEMSISSPYYGDNLYEIRPSHLEIHFKECHIRGMVNDEMYGFMVLAEIYGFDTKESLKINRNWLTQVGQIQLDECFAEAIKFYLLTMKNHLAELRKYEGKIPVDKMNVFRFRFFVLSSIYLHDFNRDEYEYLLEDIEYTINILKKINSKYERGKVSFNEIYNNFPQGLTYISESIEEEYDMIEEVLNENIDRLDYEIIICDMSFIEILSHYTIGEIKYIDTAEDGVFIYTTKQSEKWSVKVDGITEKYIIDSLIYPNVSDTNILGFKTSIRCFIPAVEKYSMLAVDEVPEAIRGKFYDYNVEKIISPITKNDVKKVNEFSDKDSFIESITETEEYKNLLDYTIKHNKEGGHTSEEIDKAYKLLIGEFYDSRS